MKRFLPITLWITIFMTSCADFEEFIDYTLKEPEIKLCLSGYVCPDSTFILLTLNNYYLIDSASWSHRTSIIAGDDATVVLFEDGAFFDSLQPRVRQVWISHEDAYVHEYYYVSHKPATPGSIYTVFAQHGDYDEVSAETHLPVPVPIQSYDVERIENDYGVFFLFSIYIQDPSFSEDYYIIPKSIIVDNNSSLSLQANPIFENFSSIFNFQLDYIRYVFFSDLLIQGELFSFEYLLFFYGNKNIPIGQQAITIFSASEDFFKYDKSRLLKENSQYDANSNPVTIYSNVVGGYGIFVGFSVSSIEVSFE